MSKKTLHRAVFPVLSLIALGAVVAAVLMRYGSSNIPRPAEPVAAASDQTSLVDERPLLTARRLAALATIAEEQGLAQNGLRLADNEVDLTFAAALRQATLHPPAPPPAARPLLIRVARLQEQVKKEDSDLARLKQLLAKADDDKKLELDEKVQLDEATLDVDKQDLDEARQELIRTGGDPRDKIQQLLEQHEAAGHQTGAPATGGTPQAEARTLLVQFRSWRQWMSKATELDKARQELREGQFELAREHAALQQEGSTMPTSAQPAGGQTAGTQVAGTQTTAAQVSGVQTPHAKLGFEPAMAPPNSASAPASASGSAQRYQLLKRAAEEHRHLAELDKRTADLQQLDSLYRQWEGLVHAETNRRRDALLEGSGWIALLLLLVLLASPLARAIIARLAPESRQRHTAQMVARLGIQAGGALLILLVLFGPPSQLATIVALAGAGLTVALKDLIVGFFGWFVLMGKNGIRPGDWVEINGIGGEVVEVGLLHTVILETGNWSDSGHPTGRKVSFVNSFAIEGHYFNFSTTGQWLWDEIEVPVSGGADPYPIAEAVHKAVAKETEVNARLAEQEWRRVVPGHVGKAFAAVPAISVRPTSAGVNVIVRYITPAHERHELRVRLFHKIVELVRGVSGPAAIATATANTAMD